MIQLGIISPPAFLNTISSQGDIHLVLAHMVLSNPSYREFYKNEKKYKILDNGAFELRQPLSTRDIIEAAELIGADEVVAPDMFDDGEKSYDLTKSFGTSVRVLSHPKEHNFKIMGVPHGKDFIEWLECFRKLYDNAHIDVIGIGYQSCRVFRHMWPHEKSLSLIRSNLVHTLSSRFTHKPIHLLGGGSNPIEILQYEGMSNVRSIDTCFPFLCGQNGIWFSETTGAERPAQATLDLTVDKLSDYQLEVVNANINVMKRWIQLGKLVKS